MLRLNKRAQEEPRLAKQVSFQDEVKVHSKPTRSTSPLDRRSKHQITFNQKGGDAGKSGLNFTKRGSLLQSATTTQVISKDEFKSLRVCDVQLFVVDYSYSLVSHTEYEVQISIQNEKHYLKSTRYRHLEAFDHVLREKFKNLDFPKLPDKKKLLNFKKEKERKAYL